MQPCKSLHTKIWKAMLLSLLVVVFSNSGWFVIKFFVCVRTFRAQGEYFV